MIKLSLLGICVAIFLSGSMSAFSQTEPEPKAVKLAMNNASHEFTVCAAFYLISSVALENSEQPDLAKKYKDVSDTAMKLASGTAEIAGLKPEATAARFEMEFLSMKDEIDGNTSNIAILLRKHSKNCQYAMENPDKRLRQWVEELSKRNQ